MHDAMLRDILRRLNALERTSARVRVGEVTGVNPLDVALGGSVTSYENVRTVAGAGFQVGDQVATLLWGNDLIVLGAIRTDQGAMSNTGAALTNVSTASESTFATWTSGPSLTIGEAGFYEAWTGPVQFTQTAASLTGARFALAKNGVAFGDTVRHVGSGAFDGDTGSAYAQLALAAGDVLTLRYATNGQQCSFSAPTIYARRIP